MSPGTLRLRRWHLHSWARWRGALTDPAPLWSATVDDVAAYLSAMGWAVETRRSARATLRSFYSWARDAGVAAAGSAAALDHPCDGLPAMRTPAGGARPTPEHAYADALAGAGERERLMLMLAGMAGLRRAEIAGLDVEDLVDTPAGPAARVLGKGGVVRLVPVPRPLAVQLLEHAGGAGPVFRSSTTGRRLTPDAVGRLIARHLPAGWSAHTLRHRFATRAYAAERDLLAVQQLLGHARAETTRRYVQLPDDATRAAAAAAALVDDGRRFGWAA